MGQSKLKSRKLAEILAGEPRCIYCANAPDTIEHMPPIAMFRARSRPNGMEFAACEQCNKGTSGADTVAAFFARISQSEIPEMVAEATVLQHRMKKFVPGVLEEFYQPDKSRKTWQRTKSGLLKPMIVVNMDGPLTIAYLKVFAAKFGMALYREHVGVALPLNGGIQFQCFMNAGLAEKTGEVMLKIMPAHQTLQQGSFMVPEQFAYRYNTDQKSIVTALAGFNSNLHIFIIATSEPEFYHFPITAPHFYFARPGGLIQMTPKASVLIK